MFQDFASNSLKWPVTCQISRDNELSGNRAGEASLLEKDPLAGQGEMFMRKGSITYWNVYDEACLGCGNLVLM